MELMKCENTCALLCLSIKRLCQVQARFEIIFRDDLIENVPLNFSIDGENYHLINPVKLVYKLFDKCNFINTIRGPN